MQNFWKGFLKSHAAQSTHGQVRTGDLVEAAWSHNALIVTNATYLRHPVAEETALRAACAEAVADAAPHGLPWLFFLYEPMLSPELLEKADSIFEEEGYHRASGLRVMTGDCSQLQAPLRPLPALEMRLVDSPEMVCALMDLNCMAYGMPLEITESVVATGAFFRDRSREFGVVGYVDGVPVSTTSVEVLNNDTLYVACVATHPDHHRKGYAETVMRCALEEGRARTGLTRTAVDASDMGRPLYAQMGYKEGPYWRYYGRG